MLNIDPVLRPPPAFKHTVVSKPAPTPPELRARIIKAEANNASGNIDAPHQFVVSSLIFPDMCFSCIAHTLTNSSQDLTEANFENDSG